MEFEKRAVAVFHELLSFTVEKSVWASDLLNPFLRELVVPQRPLRVFLKYFGVFYVSSRGKRFGVYLKEAYHRRRLIQKHPLALWKQKVQSNIWCVGKNEVVPSFGDVLVSGDEESNEDDEDKEYI